MTDDDRSSCQYVKEYIDKTGKCGAICDAKANHQSPCPFTGSADFMAAYEPRSQQ